MDSDTWTDEAKQDVRALIALPFWIGGAGILCAVIGIQTVRTSASADTEDLQEVLLGTIRKGIYFTSFLSLIASMVICGVLFGFSSARSARASTSPPSSRSSRPWSSTSPPSSR